MRTDILGVGFDDTTMTDAVNAALEMIARRGAEYIVTPNPEIVYACRKNSDLARAVDEAAMVLPDGVGIIYGAKILGTPMKERIPGIDFAAALMDRMSGKGMSVFLLGARPGVAEKAGQKLMCTHPGLVIAGTNDGYFTNDTLVSDKINFTRPDLLLVCLGSPKQELWMQKNRSALDVGLMAGLGGSLDIFSGEMQRAPEKWRRLGLEWLYRLIKEPSRIGRMSRLPLFLFAAALRRIRGK